MADPDAGVMIRLDHENYIMTGIEFVDGKYNLSTVVTHLPNKVRTDWLRTNAE